jgi:hypothetical protein
MSEEQMYLVGKTNSGSYGYCDERTWEQNFLTPNREMLAAMQRLDTLATPTKQETGPCGDSGYDRSKLPFPFNKEIIAPIEVQLYCGFADFKPDAIKEMMRAIGLKEVEADLSFFFPDTTLFWGKWVSAEYYRNTTKKRLVEMFLAESPKNIEKSLWEVAKEEFDKLSKDDQRDYISYLTHPSAFWLHPKRWEGDMDKPFYTKDLAPVESLRLVSDNQEVKK